tara:strand:- start:11507 stop:11692 length:186 start_codon:yes stop_codon:yes gene_type:complete
MDNEAVMTIQYNTIFLDVYFNFYKEPKTGYNETEINSIIHKGECLIPMLTEEQIEEIKNLL